MHSNEVAKLAGVTVRTLRHYHQLGLLSEPPRQANGYRDYSPADVARVLRIKRLAGLGFPLSRIGDVLDEMDAEGNATSASALDELDRELALEIEHLQEQRRTIAELRAEHLDPDLPVRFARILRMLSGVDTLADARAADRTALIVAGHLYDDEALGELERVVERISSENLVEAMEELDRRLDALTPDAPERERAALAEDSLAALTPVIACFDTANWLRPQPTASSSWTRSPSRTTTRPSRTCTGASNAASRPSWPSGRKGRRRPPPLHKSSTSRLTPT